MDSTQIIRSAYDVSEKGFYQILESIRQKLKDDKNENFVQSFDFSKPGKVIHAHLYYLEWKYGAVYRKHTLHYFLLYNFGINQDELQQEHKDALSDFFNIVFIDQVLKNRNLYPREFETYYNPFLVNIKKQKKEQVMDTLHWAAEGNASREDLIRTGILNLYKAGHNDPEWWAADRYAFVDTQNMFNAELDGVSDGYPPFQIKELLYWKNIQVDPFSVFTGRASETGSDSVNNPLSVKRAKSVITFLDEMIQNLKDYISDENLKLVEEGLGSHQPIILDQSNLEVAENRSVQFSFHQQHDYILLDSPKTLKQKYRKGMENVKAQINENIIAFEEALESDPVAIDLSNLIPGGGTNSLESMVDNYDAAFAIGNAAVEFGKTYPGDFSNLEQQYALPNHPEGMSLSGKRAALLMTQVIARNKFEFYISNLPLSQDIRMAGAIKIFQMMRGVLIVKEQDVLDLSDDFVEYYKHWTANPVVSHSFLFKEYDKKTFLDLLDDNEWKFRIDFSEEKEVYQNRLFNNPLSDRIEEFNLYVFNNDFMYGHNPFIPGGLKKAFQNKIDSGELTTYFWYNKDVKDYQYQMKKLIAKNVVKITVLCMEMEAIDNSNPLIINAVSKVRLVNLSRSGNIFSITGLSKPIDILTIKWFAKSGGDSTLFIL